MTASESVTSRGCFEMGIHNPSGLSIRYLCFSLVHPVDAISGGFICMLQLRNPRCARQMKSVPRGRMVILDVLIVVSVG